MRKMTLLLTLLITMALIAAACAPGAQPLAPTEVQGSAEEVAESLATQFPEAAEQVDATQALETAEAIVEAIPETGAVNETLATDLLEFSVQTMNGAVIGEVEDIVLDLDTARADYIVLNPNELLAQDEQLIPLPWDVLQIGLGANEQPVLLVTVEQSIIGEAPPIQTGEFPNVDQPGWDQEIVAYWSENATIEDEGLVSEQTVTGLELSILATNLIGFGVQGPQGTDLGTLDDIGIANQSGIIHHFLITTSEELVFEPRTVLIPTEVVSEVVGDQNIVIPLDPEDLQNAPALIGQTLENLPPGFMDMVQQFFQPFMTR